MRFAAIYAALRMYPAILPFLSKVTIVETVNDSVAKASGLLSQLRTVSNVIGIGRSPSCVSND